MLVPNRHGSSDSYRYGFNGMEMDDEFKGEGNSYDFGAKMYDPRVGRWFTPDPLEKKYPSFSTYNFSLNNPIQFKDPDGKDPIIGTITGALIGAFTEYAGIIGSKMIFDNMTFTAANQSLDWDDGIDIGVATAMGAAEWVIDNGLSRLTTWVAKPRNVKILKFIANVGIDALETALKDVLKGTEYEDMDVVSYLSGSLAEVGLGDILKVKSFKKEIDEAKEVISKATDNKALVTSTKKAINKNIKKQDAIIANQKKIVKSMNELNNTGNVLKGSVSKTAGNGTQDGVAKKKEPSKKIQAEE